MRTHILFWSYLAKFFLEWKTLQTKVVERIKIHILYSIIFFRKSRCLWNNEENTVDPYRPQMTTRRMRVTYWIPKATHAHSEYVTLIVFILQQWLPERASVFHYTYIACPLTWRTFTVRYVRSPYGKQIRFVFKEIIMGI